jgi:molecular chaperone GrpE
MDTYIENPPSDSPPPSPTFAEVTVDDLRTELADQRDLNLRLVAEFANYRRRTQQDAEREASAQKDRFIHELLPVIDNLERALASDAPNGSKEIHQGVELTLRQLQQLLRNHGIESQDPRAQRFDPHLHDAVSQRRDPAQGDHSILEVLQRGYQKGERVFRPAKVIINDRPAGGEERSQHHESD